MTRANWDADATMVAIKAANHVEGKKGDSAPDAYIWASVGIVFAVRHAASCVSPSLSFAGPFHLLRLNSRIDHADPLAGAHGVKDSPDLVSACRHCTDRSLLFFLSS